jgi:tRNA(Ile)-lysidine synthase
MPRRQPPAVGRVLERVVQVSRQEGLFHPGDRVMVACSGGPDSTCLLHALHRVRRLLRLHLVAFHFDHRLRPASDRDAAYVQRQARSLNVPFVFRRATGGPAAGQSVEAWARSARYAALGHTLDDQAETVLLGLTRGGGLEALAAMAPSGSIPPIGLPAVRPLLETSRAEVVAFNRALHLRPRQDPSNRDRRFLRNRVRLDVLPMLERRLDRGLRATLARTAAHLREDAELLEALATEAAGRVIDLEEDQARLDAAGLASLPRPIAARVVRLTLRSVAALTGQDTESGTAHIDGILDLATGRPGRRLDLPGDLVATRVRGYVRVSRPSPERSTRKGER